MRANALNPHGLTPPMRRLLSTLAAGTSLWAALPARNGFATLEALRTRGLVEVHTERPPGGGALPPYRILRGVTLTDAGRAVLATSTTA